jgi:2-hydroxymuconate-semialdehyde hydrolase
MPHNPEIGQSIVTGGFRTNVHDVGSGAPVLLIHGSGPGVSAWANWRLVMPVLAANAPGDRARHGGLWLHRARPGR